MARSASYRQGIKGGIANKLGEIPPIRLQRWLPRRGRLYRDCDRIVHVLGTPNARIAAFATGAQQSSERRHLIGREENCGNLIKAVQFPYAGLGLECDFLTKHIKKPSDHHSLSPSVLNIGKMKVSLFLSVVTAIFALFAIVGASNPIEPKGIRQGMTHSVQNG